MAQKISISLTDDLDGSEATEMVRFGLDGSQFEIDLSAENAHALRESIRPFADKARKFTAGRTRGGKRGAQARPRSPKTPQIRRWAQANGYQVSARGRLHHDVISAYYTAQNSA